ncbi:galactose-specific lectin nattectin-like [Centropristis striata]|uniref:galactose-specific lectin nattectin-like n=1 Tax=Centropristis striata TaxID=184440 RepID=UPI0027E094E9|nr:galactose-specific lectin nattectin-like [Centropristis striata]
MTPTEGKNLHTPSLEHIKVAFQLFFSKRFLKTSTSADHFKDFYRDSDINMLLFLFLFGLALGAEPPSEDQQVKLQRANCPMFWYSFNGRCYKYVATRMSWADAELHCVSQRANLVSIHSRDENNFVKSLIKNFDPVEGRTWIGLSDIHKEGRWMWSDGSVVNFLLWNAGQPDNAGGNEHCGHKNFGAALKWNDLPCSHTNTFVCAYKPNCT